MTPAAFHKLLSGRPFSRAQRPLGEQLWGRGAVIKPSRKSCCIRLDSSSILELSKGEKPFRLSGPKSGRELLQDQRMETDMKTKTRFLVPLCTALAMAG